jgi:hypothetical protein
VAPILVQTSPDLEFIGGPFFNFGETPVATTQTVTWEITNIGNGNSGAFQIPNNDDVDFSFTVRGQAPSVTFCDDLAPNEACAIQITYSPHTLGSDAALFSLIGFPLRFTVSGQGI